MAYEENVEPISVSKYECLLFDLDDTLYPHSSGLAAEVRKNIQDYMREKLAIEDEKVPELCFSLYKQYGTTMAGLKATGFDFDTDEFHSYVHGRLPYHLLKPDPALRSLLLSIPLRKFIFTNADKTHAARVLNRLRLEDCFEGVISFETLNPLDKIGDQLNLCESDCEKADGANCNGCDSFVDEVRGIRKAPICKPSEEAYRKVFEIADISPQKALFFDDSIRNLQTAKSLGLHTVLVGSSHRSEGADIALEHMHNIREALPELWQCEEKAEASRYKSEVGIETPVRA